MYSLVGPLVASIKQLAKRLDVSIGTVSRALNDRPGVNAETRAMVRRMAEEIGYIANASGRSLRRGVTNTLGLVIETDNPGALGGDNFFLALSDAMQGVMTERGYDLVILPCRRAADPVDFLRRVVRRGIVDAVIISATRRQDPRIELLLEAGLPFLTLGRSETPGDYAWIDLDFEGIARTSVESLTALSHRNICVVIPRGDANLAHIYLRAAVEALETRGLPVRVLEVPHTEAGGVEAARRLATLADRPSAVMTCSEPALQGLYLGLAEARLQPGRDLSIIGFRDNPQLRYLSPPPSCFVLDFEPLGIVVAKIITDIALGESKHSPPQVIWPMTLRETASLRPPHPG
jgi:DNA-binding LacI/PurR family transcriptional regulator